MPALATQTLYAEIGRALSAEDKALAATSSVGSTTPHLKRIRAVHHAAARLIATGMKDAEVSMNVGLCVSRLSILKNDPAFQDLITHYETAEKERFAVVQDRMAMLGMVAAEELNDRIIDSPEELTTKDLTEIMKVSLDRGGYAPVTKSEKKHVHILDSEQLTKIKESVHAESSGQVFERRPAKTLPASAGSVQNDTDSSRPVAGTKTSQGLTLEGLDL